MTIHVHYSMQQADTLRDLDAALGGGLLGDPSGRACRAPPEPPGDRRSSIVPDIRHNHEQTVIMKAPPPATHQRVTTTPRQNMMTTL